MLLDHIADLLEGSAVHSPIHGISVSPPGTGPDGRIIKKDIDSFVPTKAAPVSSIWIFKFWLQFCLQTTLSSLLDPCIQ